MWWWCTLLLRTPRDGDQSWWGHWRWKKLNNFTRKFHLKTSGAKQEPSFWPDVMAFVHFQEAVPPGQGHGDWRTLNTGWVIGPGWDTNTSYILIHSNRPRQLQVGFCEVENIRVVWGTHCRYVESVKTPHRQKPKIKLESWRIELHSPNSFILFSDSPLLFLDLEAGSADNIWLINPDKELVMIQCAHHDRHQEASGSWRNTKWWPLPPFWPKHLLLREHVLICMN